jgi:hypothetical protein
MPITDLSAQTGINGEQLGTQLAGPFGSLFGVTQKGFPSSYPIGKRFVQQPLKLTSSNGVTDLDDPTYLGFTLQFITSSPLFSGGIIGADYDSSFSNEPSAVSYLNKIGEETRASYLKSFIQGLLKINNERPYYWQTIEGLTDAWVRNTNFSVDPYVGTDKTEGIEIGCLEALDLKLTALFTLYRMAVYDTKYRRQIVPNNLLRFNLTIHIQEIRKFKTVRNWITSLNNSEKSTDTSKFVNENTSQVSFLFTDCMWDSAASGKFLDTVSNNDVSVTKTAIKFSFANISEVSQFSGYDGKLAANEKKVTSPSIESKIKTFTKDQLANQAEGAVDNLSRTASSFLQGITLGNAYGARNQLFGAINNPQSLINSVTGAAVQSGSLGSPSQVLNRIGGHLFPSAARPGGGGLNVNAFDPASPVSNSLPQNGSILPPAYLPTNNDGIPPPTISGQNNIYGSPPSGPPPLTSTNIFG